jgi:cytochrome c oxidase assembly factor CtaG
MTARVFAIALPALLYALGLARVRRWPALRSAAFGAGLAVLAAALVGLDARADAQLSAHMAQHLLLTAVAAPLLVLGAPHVLALRALRGDARAGLAAALGSRAASWLGRPQVAWPLFVAAMLAAHLTPLVGYALAHPLVHALEHALLLMLAVAFWSPVLAAPPAPHRLGPLGRVGYLFATMAPMGAIGAALVSAGAPLFAAYPSVSDQARAGAIMWVGGGLAMLAAVLASVWGALAAEERRERIREARP